MKIKIDHNIRKYIEFHANTDNEKEIYGWLLGYKENNTINIISIYTCHKYLIQNAIRAQPDPYELSNLNTILPIGIHVYGIYHSHINDVFLSETDKKTFLDILKTNENLISVVSNGEITKFYNYENDTIMEFNPEIYEYKAALSEISVNFFKNINNMKKFEYINIIKNNLTKTTDGDYIVNYTHKFSFRRVFHKKQNISIKLQMISNYDDEKILNELKIKLYSLLSNYYEAMLSKDMVNYKIYNIMFNIIDIKQISNQYDLYNDYINYID